MPRSSGRALAALLVVLGSVQPAVAQYAICDCCNVPYRVPGASWIGTSRKYGGICGDCKGKCLDCRTESDYLKTLYDGLSAARDQSAGLSRVLFDAAIDRVQGRWMDLQVSCVVGGSRDIGGITAGGPAKAGGAAKAGSGGRSLPRLGTDEGKKRVRDSIDQLNDDVADLWSQLYEAESGGDAATAEQIWDALKEAMRFKEVLNGFLKDSPEADFKAVVKPAVAPVPEPAANPEARAILRAAVLTQRNINSLGRAYLTSLQRYQAAKRARDKEAANRQVEAMGKFAAQATEAAAQAAQHYHQWQKMRLERLEQRRADLKKKELAWEDEWKAWRQKLERRWSAELAPALRKAGLSQQAADQLRQSLLELSADPVGKNVARRTAQMAFDDAVRDRFKKSKIKAPWPPPPAAPLYDLMRFHAHLLHADLHGRTRPLPADNPKQPGK
ncbi:MAG: hypothetical protein L0Y71_14610 [Gemmataceae bacterium]|nr:hypothetical protein [Gemmataceae bacterium]